MTYRSDRLIDAAERKRVASPQVPVAEWTGRVGVETTSRRRLRWHSRAACESNPGGLAWLTLRGRTCPWPAGAAGG